MRRVSRERKREREKDNSTERFACWVHPHEGGSEGRAGANVIEAVRVRIAGVEGLDAVVRLEYEQLVV
jgi:hypothetical protein